MVRAGHLVDGRSLTAVVRPHSHLRQAAALKRFVRPIECALRLNRDLAAAGQDERADACQPGRGRAVGAVRRPLATRLTPLQVVPEVDDGHRVGSIRAGPTAIGVDAGAVGELPVPYAEEPVVELDLEPQPQRASAVVADAPGVVALP